MKRERKGNRRSESTKLAEVASDYSKKSYSTSRPKPKRGKALQVLISDFTSFDAALRVFSTITIDVVREVKSRQYYRPKLTRGGRKRRGKNLERRNKERGYDIL